LKELSASSQLLNLKRMKFSRTHAYKLSGRKNYTNEKHATRGQFKFKIATSTDSFHPKNRLAQNQRGNP